MLEGRAPLGVSGSVAATVAATAAYQVAPLQPTVPAFERKTHPPARVETHMPSLLISGFGVRVPDGVPTSISKPQVTADLRFSDFGNTSPDQYKSAAEGP